MDQTTYFNQMREKRKKEILSAARKMLLKDGPASFTMQNLAKKLDISTVTLYKYFKNMEDVMSAIRDDIIPQTVGQILTENKSYPLSEGNASSLEQFLSLFHSFLSEIFKHKEDLTLLLLIDTYTQDQPVSQKHSEIITLYTEALDERAELLLVQAQKAGELRPGIDLTLSLSFVHRLVLSTLQHIGLLSAKEFRNQKSELKDYIDEIANMLRIYLSVPSDI